MAEIIRKAVNKFTKGLIMDFSPENTKNDTLTHALNATLLTFNGNELSLQNDMGNARVETAYLPEGYIPVGTCEYGGIIYIVSYNPLEDKSQIGCFPSPERNISSDELGISNCSITKTIFQSFKEEANRRPTGELNNVSQCVLLRNGNLNPGDKFLVSAGDSIYDEAIKDMFKDNRSIAHPRIALNVVSIEESGKIVYLNSEIRKYEVPKKISETSTVVYKYHLLGNLGSTDSQESKKTDIDNYRNVLSSGYSVFKSKTSGKLALLAELIMIDSFSVTHGLVPKVVDGKGAEGCYDIVLYPEITPEVTSTNYLTVPKLKYYCLENSQGYLQVFDDSTNTPINMFSGDPVVFNNAFLNYRLSQLYTPITPGVTFTELVGTSSKFNFPKPGTYHGQMQSVTSINKFQYTKLSEDKFHRLTYDQINEQWQYFKVDLQVKIYWFNAQADGYSLYEEAVIDPLHTYYTKKTEPVYSLATSDQKNEVLFKIVNTPTTATTEIIEDTTIEKFQYREIYIYRKATEKEVEEHTNTLWEKGTNTWTEVVTPVVGVEYYIQERKREIVSIGYEVDRETILGSVYYYPNSKIYIEATPEEKEAAFSDEESQSQSQLQLYYISNYNDVYEKASITEIDNYVAGESKLYYNTQYVLIKDTEAFDSYSSDYQLFVVSPVDVYVPKSKLVPNTTDNYIYDPNTPGTPKYPKDDPLYLYKISDFMPVQGSDNTYSYQDCVLGDIKFPKEVLLYNLDLPFKYDYTITPCMDYGKLKHLSVSNTVDFSKLHLFEQSNFTTWKYHIDGNQLRLTFGAEIYDTYEVDKVDGLVLEFYDLWGFAGSLEVSGKKAYSGIFTKIIPLNTLNALSKKKITGTETLELFKRNINIKEQGVDSFIFNSKAVKYSNDISGWVYTDTGQPISDLENDCGVLYSNLVYGVKTYLKMLKSDGSTAYIPKKELFLFTIPIYNDYYYTTDNFNTLENPTLDMVLTYKLVDSSHKVVYDKGYNNYDDSVKITDYLGGAYEGTFLDVTKYYKYYGTTNLYLEVGLKKEYSDVGMGYSPEINKYFSCDLQLMSNEDENKALTITSSDSLNEPAEQLLCYTKVGGEPIENDASTQNSETDGENSELNTGTYTQYSLDLNRIGFGDSYDKTKQISTLSGHNFINTTSEYNTPIPICYSFVVGYKINVDNIRASKIPMTTLCALYHKDSSGVMNDYDFGIYTITESKEGTVTTTYLSDIIFYNCGDEKEEIFGVCKQTKSTGTIEEQCSSMDEVRTAATVTTTAGKLNSGNPLKQLSSYVGKLMFGQPHIHGFGDAYRTNINKETQAITTGDSIHETKTNKYNFCANTKTSIDYNSEFISLIYNLGEGITGATLVDYNEKLLKTMSGVYAYNPNYDTFDIKVGDVSIQDKKVQFISNLISRNAKFDFNGYSEEGKVLSLNNFIYVGPTDFSTYLTYLNTHSKIKVTAKYNGEEKVLKQVQFTPNYTYCGTKDDAYLISTLTYNTPTPTEVTDELSFQANDLFAVRKSDGSTLILEGSPNKKTLYGLYEYKTSRKIFNLDVSNYKIAEDGTLSYKGGYSEKETSVIYIPISDSLGSFNSNNGKYSYTETLQGTKFYNCDYTTVFKVTATKGATVIYDPTNTRVILFINKKDDSVNELKFRIDPTMPEGIVNDDSREWTTDKSYVSVTGALIAAEINSKILTGDSPFITLNNGNTTRINLKSQTPQLLHDITLSDPKLVKYKYGGLNGFNQSIYEDSSDCFWESVSQDNILGGASPYMVGWPADGITIPLQNVPKGSAVICSITINQLIANVTRTGNISEAKANIVEMPTTSVESYVGNSNAYLIKDNYKTAALKHTTITLNDLIYEPNIDGHRLYLRRTNKWVSKINNPIYYRKSGYKSKEDNKDYNKLIPYKGPTLIE